MSLLLALKKDWKFSWSKQNVLKKREKIENYVKNVKMLEDFILYGNCAELADLSHCNTFLYESLIGNELWSIKDCIIL